MSDGHGMHQASQGVQPGGVRNPREGAGFAQDVGGRDIP